MPPTKPVNSPEFKAEAVKLYQTSSQRLKEVAGDLDVSANALLEWVRQAEREGSPAELLAPDERAAGKLACPTLPQHIFAVSTQLVYPHSRGGTETPLIEGVS